MMAVFEGPVEVVRVLLAQPKLCAIRCSISLTVFANRD